MSTPEDHADSVRRVVNGLADEIAKRTFEHTAITDKQRDIVTACARTVLLDYLLGEFNPLTRT